MSEPTMQRRVSTDALETLGKLHEREEKRDAIHLAVEPVEAHERLPPGAHIAVVNGKAHCVPRERALGIVDPFLERPVEPGERFWFVMYPRAVHSLRHVWTHPAFPDAEAANVAPSEANGVARARIVRMADEMGLSYSRLMEYARDWLETDDYRVQYRDESWRNHFNAEEFWPAYEQVTGESVAEGRKQSFFSCTC